MTSRFDVADVEDVTREDFLRYEAVRKSGAFNMLTEVQDAAEDAGLELPIYRAILRNYAALSERFQAEAGR